MSLLKLDIAVKVQKEITNMIKFGFSLVMGICFSILLFIWVAQLW
jgi:hypothetical protein